MQLGGCSAVTNNVFASVIQQSKSGVACAVLLLIATHVYPQKLVLTFDN